MFTRIIPCVYLIRASHRHASWGCISLDVHLVAVYLMGVYLMGVFLMDVYFIDVYLMSVYLMGVSYRNVSGQTHSTDILHSQAFSAIIGREGGMTSPHTNLYENASKASHCRRRRHLVVVAAL
jgi:hypothetical protein